jgi:hypothetical protein
VQKPYRIGRQRTNWLLAPIGAAVTAVVFMFWPTTSGQELLVANRDIPAGELLSPNDLVLTNAQIGDSASAYLKTVDQGYYTLTPLAKGQLVARSAVAPNPASTLLPTVFTIKDSLPRHLRVGSEVDVWVATSSPKPIALDCQVQAIFESTSLGLKTNELELGCLAEFLPDLLSAKAANSQIAVVLQPTATNN